MVTHFDALIKLEPSTSTSGILCTVGKLYTEPATGAVSLSVAGCGSWCGATMTERYVRTPIATASTSGPRCTPQTDGSTPLTDAVQTAPRTVLQTAARPLTPTQENQLINTVTKLGARAAPAALLSVISICRQYLAEPQQQTAVLQTSPN